MTDQSLTALSAQDIADVRAWIARQHMIPEGPTLDRLLEGAEREVALRAELDKVWGIDNLVDIHVEQPGDYLLVLGELITMARRAPESRDLIEARETIEQHWNAYCGAEARRKASVERETIAQDHRARAEAELAKSQRLVMAGQQMRKAIDDPSTTLDGAMCAAMENWDHVAAEIALADGRYVASTEQRTLDEHGQPRPHYSCSSHGMTRCQSNDDGDCDWSGCPQLRDGEPMKTGRHCPLDNEPEGD